MEKLTRTELEEALRGLPVGEIHCFDAIGSTNDFAFERAAAGAPDLSIITAFEQTKGRGRMQRTWVTVPGTSLPMTVLIRPKAEETDCISLFAPLTGLAVHEALRIGFSIESQIKWPNDVLIHRRKICGILCETQWEGSRPAAIILGFGTNILHGAAPKMEHITYPASSIEDETGIIIPRAEWIRAFIEQLIRLRPLLGKPEFFALWEKSLAYKGEEAFFVRADGNTEICTVLGIDHEGNLIVRNQNGEEKRFLAGEISLRPMQ